MNDTKKMFTILKHCLIKNKLPTKIWIEVTDACNSHCIHCSIWKKEKTKNMLTVEEYHKFFNDPYLSDINEVIISGGEPFLRKDIKQIVLIISKSHPNAGISLSTNGLMPYTAARIVRELLEEGVKNLSVGTSLDYTGSKHDEIRGTPDAYRKVTNLLWFLQRVRKDYPELGIGFGTVLQKANQDNIQEIIKFANENGFFYLIQHMNRSGFYGDSPAEQCTNELEIVSNLPERFNILRELWMKKLSGGSIKFNCYALRDFFVLKCNGDVVPCLSKWNEISGNIREKNIGEILPHTVQCDGCLNSWGTAWSFEAGGWPYLKYYLTNPRKLWRKLK